MKPRGMLMIEHRLIEKMLRSARAMAGSITAEDFDPVLIDKIVDFIRVYADRTHHGKEEDILFADLENRHLNAKDSKLMNDLIQEHKQAREKVKEIVRLNSQYKSGDSTVVSDIRELIIWLADFYPQHIEKEDAVFFPGADEYFSDKELEDMVTSFREFDQRMIHEKYQMLYEEIKR